jgi:hypothetical protein
MIKKTLKVKVIKKDEQRAKQPVQTKVAESPRAAAREMVSTVADWVTDFQKRKRDETKTAIGKFFSQHPRPNES